MKRKIAISTRAIVSILVIAGCANESGITQAATEQHGHASEGGSEHQHEHDNTSGVVRLTEPQRQEFDIRVREAVPGTLEITLDLPAEVRLNEDAVAHVVPKLSGIVTNVHKTIRDQTQQGELMATLDSRELADAKSEYLIAIARHRLARETFEREKGLWQEEIAPERDYLVAKRDLEEARINVDAAEQKLHALGVPQELVDQLPEQPDMALAEYRIRAPFSGLVINKHISLGEFLSSNATAFTLADLSTVWVDITVYRSDLGKLEPGQSVTIEADDADIPSATSQVQYIIPILGESTRTATARVVLDNPDRRWRPGLFVTAHVSVDTVQVGVRVPRSAVIKIDGQDHLFVEVEGGFEPRPVNVGQTTTEYAEILSGLEPGQTYVAEGAFTLKAERGKGQFGGHSH